MPDTPDDDSSDDLISELAKLMAPKPPAQSIHLDPDNPRQYRQPHISARYTQQIGRAIRPNGNERYSGRITDYLAQHGSAHIPDDALEAVIRELSIPADELHGPQQLDYSGALLPVGETRDPQYNPTAYNPSGRLAPYRLKFNHIFHTWYIYVSAATPRDPRRTHPAPLHIGPAYGRFNSPASALDCLARYLAAV